jgi:formylglycine-generating enzyme required for sulfatase activity
VTNAQFKTFENSFEFTIGHDNYPAVVSKSQALNYIKWLSQQTGESYRLPNTTEAQALHKTARKAAKNENVFNAWAGYDIVKSDAAKLMEKVTPNSKTLLKPVGSSKAVAVNDAKLYDLGGNVAEYFESGVYGYSAYDYFDANDEAMINSKFVGFRVVKE